MWLSKEKRILLALYYRSIKRPGNSHPYRNQDLMSELKRGGIKADAKFVESINYSLQSYSLLTLRSSTNKNDEVIITLCQPGYQLGKKYNCKLGTISLWCTEYLWFWVILGVVISFIGILVTILVAILKD